MGDDLQKTFEKHASETTKTLKHLTDAVSELGGRIAKVETLAKEAKHAAERAKMDGEGTTEAIMGAFAHHKNEIAKVLETHAKASDEREKDRKFYLRIAMIVIPVLSAAFGRGAQEIGRAQPVPVTLAPQVQATMMPTIAPLPALPLEPKDGGR